MSAMLIAPGEGRKANWKASHGPTKSIVSAPRPTMKATGILPWAGGVSLVADGLGCSCPNASPAKEMKTAKMIDSLFWLLYTYAVYFRVVNTVLRRFNLGWKPAATAARVPIAENRRSVTSFKL